MLSKQVKILILSSVLITSNATKAIDGALWFLSVLYSAGAICDRNNGGNEEKIANTKGFVLGAISSALLARSKSLDSFDKYFLLWGTTLLICGYMDLEEKNQCIKSQEMRETERKKFDQAVQNYNSAIALADKLAKFDSDSKNIASTIILQYIALHDCKKTIEQDIVILEGSLTILKAQKERIGFKRLIETIEAQIMLNKDFLIRNQLN